MFRLTNGVLAKQARERADEIAFFHPGGVLTWRDWEDQVGRIAGAFAGLGIGASTRVAVRTGICYEWFVVHAALSRVGATMIAVSRQAAMDEVSFMLEHSDAAVLLIDDRETSPFKAIWRDPARLISLTPSDGSSGLLNWRSLLQHAPIRDPLGFDATAGIILYTSGTTGRPKGLFRDPAVFSARRNWMNRVFEELDERAGRSPRTRRLFTHPVHHTAGTQTCLDTLVNGGSVVIQPKFDAEATLANIERYRITAAMMVPTMLHRIRALEPATISRYDTLSLTRLELGGASVPAELKVWAKGSLGPQCGIHEAYGASEMYLVAWAVPQDAESHPGSSGRVLDSIEVAIVDAQGARCALGQTGEICARTPMLIPAYLNAAPLSFETGELTVDGLYRSGDTGYLDAEGYLYVTGRLKDMIISGGVNIYPAEVERVLGMHPSVIEAAVVGAPNAEFGEEVVAFCEIRAGGAVSNDELITWCRGKLAGYKVPRRLRFVSSLPRTESGKVAKGSLRERLWCGVGREI